MCQRRGSWSLFPQWLPSLAVEGTRGSAMSLYTLNVSAHIVTALFVSLLVLHFCSMLQEKQVS